MLLRDEEHLLRALMGTVCVLLGCACTHVNLRPVLKNVFLTAVSALFPSKCRNVCVVSALACVASVHTPLSLLLERVEVSYVRPDTAPAAPLPLHISPRLQLLRARSSLGLVSVRCSEWVRGMTDDTHTRRRSGFPGRVIGQQGRVCREGIPEVLVDTLRQ